MQKIKSNPKHDDTLKRIGTIEALRSRHYAELIYMVTSGVAGYGLLAITTAA